jgi:DNA-binding transcriptional ArsR family regulator
MDLDRPTADVYASWFKCLADPTRILILNLLASTGGAMTVGEIVAAVDVGQSTVSHHLKILAETRFVLVEQSGASNFYRVNERCVDCFPSAAELIMGRVRVDARQPTAAPSWLDDRGRRLSRQPTRRKVARSR